MVRKEHLKMMKPELFLLIRQEVALLMKMIFMM